MPETLLARKFADAIGAPFEDAFRYQFVISEKTLDLDEFDCRKLGCFNIYTSPLLPTTQLCIADGSVIGWALGYPVTPEGVLLDGIATVDVDMSAASAEKTLEDFVCGLSGRYAVFLCFESAGQSHARLYTDCIGALGALYDPTSHICASTLLLCLNRDIDPHPIFRIPAVIYEIPEFAPLLPEQATDTGVQTTSFGESFDLHVRQLLTNHVLDLNRFEAHRLELPVAPTEPLAPEDAAALIIERLHSNMAALQPTKAGYLAISGGLDSRMLMAAAPKGYSAQMQYYSYSDNWITGIDMRLAGALSERVGEQFMQQPPPDDEGQSGSFFQRDRRSLYFQKRCAVSSGLKTTGDDWWRNGYFRSLSRGGMWLRGNALEVVSARLWTPTVDARLRKALRHALRRLGLETADAEMYATLRERLMEWRETLPDHALPLFHDFWYQELFLSHSQGQFYGLNELVYYPPASDRALFAAARSVEPGLRRTNVLYDAIIDQARPDLKDIPTTRQILQERKQSGLELESIMDLHSIGA